MQMDQMEAWQRAAAAGDEAAFERLYACFEQRIRLAAWRFCRRGDVADELADEAWCRAFQARKSYDPTRPFPAWVAGILHNVWREQARNWSATADRGRGNQGLSDEVDPAITPESALAEAELLEALNACVAGLTPEQRDIVRWRFFEGQSLRAVAQRLAMPESTLREHRLPEIVTSLQACLRTKGIREDFFSLSAAHPGLRLQYPNGDVE